MNASHPHSILGSLLGTAVGDAMGLPMEGLSRQCIARRWGRRPLRHRLALGRGMLSDDSEHTMMLAAALTAHGDEIAAFQRAFSWKLRWWFLALPAGVGMATATAILRLWLGFPAWRSGVKSAGNGAAMRSAIVGVVFREDAVKRRKFALAACRVTHRDTRAEESAVLVAEAAALASSCAPAAEVLRTLDRLISTVEMRGRFAKLVPMLAAHAGVDEYARGIGCERGVSGFAPDTVAVALYAWLRHRCRFEDAIRSVIECGGDTDTVAAITGGICGAEVGEDGIPREWIDGICDQPRSVDYIRRLAAAFGGSPKAPPSLFWPAVPVRNLFFLAIVILHGFRRIFPLR